MLTAPAREVGCTHVRILRATGRNDDMPIVRGVNVYPTQIEAGLVGRPGLAPHYELVVERRGYLDQVTVEIEALAGVERSGYEALRRDAIHHVKSTLGITVDVVVKPPGSLARAQGKAQRVRDPRPH